MLIKANIEEEMEVFGIPLAREREMIHHVEAVASMMKSFLGERIGG